MHRQSILLIRCISRLFTIVLLFSYYWGWAAQESQEQVDFKYGERLYGEGLFSLAVIQFNNYVENYPNSVKAHEAQFLLGESNYFLEHYSEAQKSYLKLIFLYPSSPHVVQAQFRIAECFDKMGDSSEAIESYYSFYTYFPESQWALESLYNAGQLSLQVGNFQKAESLFQLILELTSTGEYRSKTLFLLSHLYEQQGKYEKAIEILQSCISHPIAVIDRDKALYSLGIIYEVLGNWSESEKQYRQIIEVTENEEFKRGAWFRLGVLMKVEVENEKARDAFQHVIQSGENDSLCTKSFYYLGEISKYEGDFQSAFNAFLSAEKRSTDPEERLASILEKAKCLELLGESQIAINEYQKIVDDTNDVESILKKGILSIAHLYVTGEVFERAAYYYRQYLTLFPDDQLTDVVLLRLGKIYFENLNQFDSGFRTLNRIWDDYPASRLMPESRFVYAKALEEMGRREEAIQVYSLLYRYFPGTDWAKKAIGRLNQIETYFSVDYREGLSQLAVLVQKTLSSPNDPNVLFELGEVSFQYLKEYEDAIQYFKSYLSLHQQDEKMDVILFQIGQSYEALYLMDRQSAYLDSTKRFYHAVISGAPNGSYAYEAGIRIANLETIENTLLGYQSYRDLLMKYPDGYKNDEILYLMGGLSMQNDSVYSAIKHFQRFITEYPESEYQEEAFYFMGKIHYQIGNYHAADSLFNLYKNHYSDGEFLPEITYYQAKCAILLEDVDSAILLLEQFDQNFYFSPWSDSCNRNLASLYLQTAAYQKAAALYQKMTVEDSLQFYLSSMGLVPNRESQDNDNLIGLAKAYEGLKKYKEANRLYFQLLRNNQDIGNHVFALSSLARLAEEENHISRAMNYLSTIVNEFPADSTVEQLGLLYFRLGQYDKAQQLLDQALTLSPSEEHQIFISSRAIVALYRQKMIPQADARIAIFEKSYKNDPQLKKFLSEFTFEKGLIYSQEKEFDLALNIFKDIVQKYKDTEYVPSADLEIGRIYLITNKIEDALNKLTYMVEQYPNHPVLAKVYLNLGDHYFRSNQYENALRSFKLAIQNDSSEEVVPVAMRYLIRVYDSLRMWDAALSTAREYIGRFPEAEDILEKRIQIGIFYMDLNEYTRAIEYLRDVKRNADFETEAEIQYWIGKCFYNMGQFEQAIFEFLKVKYLSKPTQLPWDTTALYEAGLAYTKLDKPQEALKLFQKIVEQEGATSDLGRIARERIKEIESN